MPIVQLVAAETQWLPSQVIDGASTGDSEQQQAAKSKALSYCAELESILRAAAAQVNGFSEQQDMRQAIHELQQQLQARSGITRM